MPKLKTKSSAKKALGQESAYAKSSRSVRIRNRTV